MRLFCVGIARVTHSFPYGYLNVPRAALVHDYIHHIKQRSIHVMIRLVFCGHKLGSYHNLATGPVREEQTNYMAHFDERSVTKIYTKMIRELGRQL